MISTIKQISDRCEMCRNSCKGIAKEECRFYPKDCFLGNEMHFREDPTRYYSKHESTSRICVVCKEYFNHRLIKWWKGKMGMYSFCPACWKRHLYVLKTMPLMTNG
jgi:hypothetical protein